AELGALRQGLSLQRLAGGRVDEERADRLRVPVVQMRDELHEAIGGGIEIGLGEGLLGGVCALILRRLLGRVALLGGGALCALLLGALLLCALHLGVGALGVLPALALRRLLGGGLVPAFVPSGDIVGPAAGGRSEDEREGAQPDGRSPDAPTHDRIHCGFSPQHPGHFPGHPQNAMVTGGKALRSRGTDGAAPAAWGGSALGWCVEARHAQESAVSTESPAAPGPAPSAPIRLRHLKQAKERGRPFSMLTAYDQFSAQAFEAAGIEVLLVGDSVGTTVLGYDSTTSTTHQDMLTFTGAVARSVSRPLVVADLAFGTYEAGPDDALRHGVELVRAGAGAVKLEGGAEMARQVRTLVQAGVPVLGHLGFTPQSVNSLSGHRVQGRDEAGAQKLRADALALQEAGVAAI